MCTGAKAIEEEATLRKRLTSIKSINSDGDGGETTKDAEVEEELPDVPFSRIMGMNKPEMCYIIREFQRIELFFQFDKVCSSVRVRLCRRN